MPFMTWTPELELPHEGINVQHKALVAAVNAFAEAVRSAGEVDPMPTLVFITRYAEEHFRDEEALMIAAAYPDYASHRATHQALFGDVQSRVEAYIVRGDSATLLGFLEDWLRLHISGPDLVFARFLAARQPPKG